ncbi:DUF6538 domain-containing protein [Cupriavidus sp. 2MCAB6]|uniref:DUF6538 domain-containing protein n=1 Tax=Cupriavidus sp. 2MCAB6 TaxID=3232981 RepID=UPI003F9023EC
MSHPYLATRKNSRNLYFRRAIPAELRPILQRHEIWISLKTPCRKTAVTRLREATRAFNQTLQQAHATLLGQTAADCRNHVRGAASGEWLSDIDIDIDVDALTLEQVESLFARYRTCALANTTTERQELTPALIERVVERYRAHALASEEEQRLGISPAELDERRALATLARTQSGLARATRDDAYVDDLARDILSAEKLHFDPASPTYKTFRAALLKNEVETLDEELARLAGDGHETPPLWPLISPADTWEAAFDSWCEGQAPSARSVAAARSLVEYFKKLTGKALAAQITFDDIETYKRRCAETVSLATINKNLSILSGVLGHAIRAHQCSLPSNPFQGTKYSKKAVLKGRRSRRDAYTVSELNCLLRSPVVIDGVRPPAGAGEAAYWLPHLGYMTGARLEDLCSLRPGDIVQREGVWCAHLHDAKREKRLGISSIMRYVPLHANLLAMGFLDYVEQRRMAAPTERLFPALRPDKWGNHGKSFGAWFNRYLDGLGLDDPRLTFHGFRHTFRAFCEESGLSQAVTDALMGKAKDNDYGRNEGGEKRLPFSVLVQAMERLRFPGVRLEHLCANASRSPSESQ